MAGHQMPRQKRSSVDGLSGLSRIQKEIDRTRYLTMNIYESMNIQQLYKICNTNWSLGRAFRNAICWKHLQISHGSDPPRILRSIGAVRKHWLVADICSTIVLLREFVAISARSQSFKLVLHVCQHHQLMPFGQHLLTVMFSLAKGRGGAATMHQGKCLRTCTLLLREMCKVLDVIWFWQLWVDFSLYWNDEMYSI